MRSLTLAVLALLPAAAAFADAPPPPPFEGVVPKAEGLVLDGKLDEEAWKTALTIPAEPLDGDGGGPTPEVKVLTGTGCLWVSAKVAEDPGFAMGVRWMIAPDKTASAADCVALTYSPQDLRCSEFTVRGPRGSGRQVYRFSGQADVTQAGAWTIEMCLALADLPLPAADTPIRLAVAVSGRIPNRLSSAPPDSAFHSPSAFALLRPPAPGWPIELPAGEVLRDDIAGRDGRDAKRREAWSEALALAAQGRSGSDEHLAALGRAILARPDLLTLRPIRGDARVLAGDVRGAKTDYHDAGHAGAFGRLRLDVFALLRPEGREDSDYEATFSTIEGSVSVEFQQPWARGLLRFRHGEFEEATRDLERLAKVLAFDEEIVTTARRAKEWGAYGGQELALQKRDAEKNDLPRLRITTSKGPVVVELFEGEAPNTVKNFVWLAEAHAYDGLAFEIPERFRRVTSGEPTESTSRWAIRTELTKRKPFRGMVAMANRGVDTEWARFFFVTGTLPEVDGQVTVFGRVLEGQDVVDRLISTDKIERVEIVRKRPNVEYRPTTVAGTPAPPLK